MLSKNGYKDLTLLWNVTLLAKEEGWLTLMQNLSSNWQPSSPGKTQISGVYGEQVMMDWNAARKKLRNGLSKKQPNPHLVLAGVRQATQEVYDHSYWNV
jgi:hypothetical protein